MLVAIQDCTLTSRVFLLAVNFFVSEHRLIKVVFGIKKSRKVTSSRVSTSGLSHDTSMGERI